MRGKVLFVSLVSILLGVCNVMADVVIIHPSDDAYVDSSSPGGNYGSEATVSVRQGTIADEIHRTYLKFDLSCIPRTHQVASARIRLSCTYRRATDPNVGLYWLADDAWDESTITWSNAPTGFNENTTATDMVDFGDNFWTVTKYVRSAREQDIVLNMVAKLTDETRRNNLLFSSKEAVDANSWPYLEVETVPPILISTAEDLNNIGKDPNMWDQWFALANDINLAEFSGTQFNRIGRYYGYYDPNNLPFTGVFDGNGHAISNFTYECGDGEGIGLFGHVNDPNAVIRNLTLVSPDVNSPDCNIVGALVAYLITGTVSNCGVEGGTVSGRYYVGGVVGYNLGWVTDSYATCNVTGGAAVGGLVGYNEGAITNSCAHGDVSGGATLGGLAGGNGGWIIDCHASGSVTGTGGAVGGLVGLAGMGQITASCATGSVSGTDDIGGLTGITWGQVEITNCYARGSVVGRRRVGGLLGSHLFNWEMEVPPEAIDCYSTGRVEGIGDVGGLIGYKDVGLVFDCFWDKETSGQTTSDGGTGKTTAQMQTKSTFTGAGWDFAHTWDICGGTNYPKLLWQIPVTGDFLCPDGVDILDYSFFAQRWGDEDCGSSNDCDRTDLDLSNAIDWGDMKILCDYWLQGTNTKYE